MFQERYSALIMEKKKTSQNGGEHKRTTITEEEENYVRLSLLISGISLRAVRAVFNREFDPNTLNEYIKKEYDKLKILQRKRMINIPQWNLLHPYKGRYELGSGEQKHRFNEMGCE